VNEEDYLTLHERLSDVEKKVGKLNSDVAAGNDWAIVGLMGILAVAICTTIIALTWIIAR
jgi:hypothetical protein